MGIAGRLLHFRFLGLAHGDSGHQPRLYLLPFVLHRIAYVLIELPLPNAE